MTNGEMLDIFYQKYPELKVEDYRPLCPEIHTKDLIGITVWLKNGDTIQYYPKEAQTEREGC